MQIRKSGKGGNFTDLQIDDGRAFRHIEHATYQPFIGMSVALKSAEKGGLFLITTEFVNSND